MSNQTNKKRVDQTKMINQPALQTSTGRVWLVMGGLFAAVALVPFTMMIINLEGRTRAIAIATAATVVLCYFLMIVARLAIPQGPLRLRIMGACMLTMAGLAFIGALLASGSQWSAV